MAERINLVNCPECFEPAVIYGRGVHAECRGDGPCTNMRRQGHLRGTPVFKCGRCAALFFVRFSYFGRRAESVRHRRGHAERHAGRLVDAEVDRMERMEALEAVQEPRS